MKLRTARNTMVTAALAAGLAATTTAAAATVPRAMAPRATAPRATAPRATAPRATAPRATAPRATVSHAINFQTLSKSVYCGIVSKIPGTAFDPGVGAQMNGDWPGLQCSAAGIGPKHPTEGDPFVQIGQGKTGRARLVEVGDDDLASSKAPVTLKAGARWSKDGISCTVTAASVTCTNTSGHGFTVSTGHLKTH